MRGIFRILAALVTFLAYAPLVPAQQSFPTKPVRLLIPYAAGGAVDILGRRMVASVLLVEALGGGWSTEDLPSRAAVAAE